MVEKKFVNTILKRLEKYLIEKNGFHLLGENYDLILFIPSDKYLSDTKYSLLISAKKLNNFKQKEVIKDLLTDFKAILKSEEYNAISRLNIIHTDDPFVKNIKHVFPFYQEITEINDMPIGGFNIDYAFLVKSPVLDKLIENHALTLEIKNQDNKLETINAGIIRIENDYEVVYYTGKGLREIDKPYLNGHGKTNSDIFKQKDEAYLFQNHFMAKTRLDDIVKVVA